MNCGVGCLPHSTAWAALAVAQYLRLGAPRARVLAWQSACVRRQLPERDRVLGIVGVQHAKGSRVLVHCIIQVNHASISEVEQHEAGEQLCNAGYSNHRVSLQCACGCASVWEGGQQACSFLL